MNARFTYVDTIMKSRAALPAVMYRNDARRLLLRVPHELTPDQAKGYEDWLKKFRGSGSP